MHCLICEKKIETHEGKICTTCKDFFLTDEKITLEELTARFQEAQDYLNLWRSESIERRPEDEA